MIIAPPGIESLSPTMTKIQPSFFYEPKENLLTGEETPLDLLLLLNGTGIVLNDEIQNHINGFLEEPLEEPYMGYEEVSYLQCHDDMLNPYVYPIEPDEKHCFVQEYDDDFVIDESVFGNSD
jgi:hypothetical protein